MTTQRVKKYQSEIQTISDIIIAGRSSGMTDAIAEILETIEQRGYRRGYTASERNPRPEPIRGEQP